jgi:thiol-disulfide isomerase/thioredoxin
MSQSRLQKTAAFSLCAVLAVAPWATAQVAETRPTEADTQPAVTLKIGDPAPALKVEKWLKGDPVQRFETGKVYVLEFWATWCGPCTAAMPHVTALQKTYQGKVTIIGVDVWEDKDYTDETLKKVEDFVKEQRDRMGYSVAYDGKGRALDTAYMQAAGQNGIPTVFLIDQTGTLAWIGHPLWLDMPLELVVAGKWDRTTGPAQVAKAQQRAVEIGEKMSAAPKEAVPAWQSFERDYPTAAPNFAYTKFMVYLLAADYEQAYKVGRQLVADALAQKDALTLNAVAWAIVDPKGDVRQKDLDLALQAATQADELTRHEYAAIIDTLARVYFVKGDLDRAIEFQTKAVARAEGIEKEDLQATLDEYKAAQAQKK